MDIAKSLGKHIKERGFSYALVAKVTGIPYYRVNSCLSQGREKRARLTADEAVTICKYFKIDLMKLAKE